MYAEHDPAEHDPLGTHCPEADGASCQAESPPRDRHCTLPTAHDGPHRAGGFNVPEGTRVLATWDDDRATDAAPED